MKTSLQWWEEVRDDKDKFINWLKKQYHGEKDAVYRIAALYNKLGGSTAKDDKTIDLIIKQEAQHADWVGKLLISRGHTPEYLADHKTRYWKETLGEIKSIEEFAAIAAHAEEMRLGRIRVIAADPDAPEDVRDTFQRILFDEEFHAKAFKEMSTPEAYHFAKANHRKGMEAIGLVA